MSALPEPKMRLPGTPHMELKACRIPVSIPHLVSRVWRQIFTILRHYSFRDQVTYYVAFQFRSFSCSFNDRSDEAPLQCLFLTLSDIFCPPFLFTVPQQDQRPATDLMLTLRPYMRFFRRRPYSFFSAPYFSPSLARREVVALIPFNRSSRRPTMASASPPPTSSALLVL